MVQKNLPCHMPLGTLKTDCISQHICLQFALASNGCHRCFFEDRLMTGAVLWNVDLSNISVKTINSLELHALWKLKRQLYIIENKPIFSRPVSPPLLFSLFSPSIAFPFLFFPSPVLFSSLFFSLCPPLFPLPSTLAIKEHFRSFEDQNIISNSFQRGLF